ncbi:hypothetical protein Hanom_Chr01g00086371 [Helianthus anomalus]
MFSNLSRSCVRGRTSEHGMRRRIMLKSPCSKHLTRASRTTSILANSSEESLTLREWSTGHRHTGVVCRTSMHQHNMRTLPKLSGPSKDAGR